MRDRFGRDMTYMRIAVTDRCNERCVYCVPEGGLPCLPAESLLTDAEIICVVRAAARLGIRHIRLTGGEPLLREGLPGLVREILSVPGIRDVSLTTNGTLLADRMPELYGAGLRSVNISLDAADPEVYASLTRGGDLRAVLRGMEAAEAYPDVTVKLDAVLLDPERQRIPEIAAFAKKKPVHVRFIELMPVGEGRRLLAPGGRAVTGAEALRYLENCYGPSRPSETPPIGHGPAVYRTFAGFSGQIGFIAACSACFCASCNRVRLTAQGLFKTCLQYRAGCDLMEILRSGDAAAEERVGAAMRVEILKKPEMHAFSRHGEGALLEDEGMSRIGG